MEFETVDIGGRLYLVECDTLRVMRTVAHSAECVLAIVFLGEKTGKVVRL